jgi:hypothetical protein
MMANTADDKQYIPDDDEDFISLESGSTVDENSASAVDGGSDDPADILQRELDKAKRERDTALANFQAAESRRATAEAEAHQRGHGERQAQKAAIEQAIAAAEAQGEALERAYAEAADAGNTAEMAKVQRAMVQHETRATRYQDALEQINAAGQQTQQRQTQQAADPTEAHIAKFSQPAQAWLRKHKDDVYANEMRGNMAYAGHVMAVNTGIKPDTDEYFAYLDKHMGYNNKTGGTVTQQDNGSGKRVAAPPSRGTAMNNSGTKITLTAEERAMAEDLGMTVAEYAQGKQLMAAQQGKRRA